MGGIISGLLLYMTSKIYLLIRKREGMGMGDVKMITMIGFWMGSSNYHNNNYIIFNTWVH